MTLEEFNGQLWPLLRQINDSINDTVNHIMLDELVRESRKVNPAGECKGPQCSRT